MIVSTATDRCGRTPLLRAALSGSRETVNAVLSHPLVDIEAVDDDGELQFIHQKVTS